VPSQKESLAFCPDNPLKIAGETRKLFDIRKKYGRRKS